MAGGARRRHDRLGRATEPTRGGQVRPPCDRSLTLAVELLEAAHRPAGGAAQSAMPAAAARAAATVVRHGHVVGQRRRPGCGRRRPAARGPAGCSRPAAPCPPAISSTASAPRPSSPTLATSVATVDAVVAQVAGRARAWRPGRSPARRSCRATSRPRRLVPVGQREEDRARSSGSRVPAAIWLLAKARPKVASTPITSPVERISGPSSVSTPGKRSKGSTASFTLTWPGLASRPCRCRRAPARAAQLGQGLAHHDPGGDLGHGHPGGLGHEGDGAAGPGVRLEDEHRAVLHGVLHVEQAHDLEGRRRGPGCGVQRRRAPRPPGVWGGRAHAESPECTPASSTCSMTPPISTSPAGVPHGVDVDLDGVLEEPVDQHRPLGGDPALAGQPGGPRRAAITRRTPSSS